MSPLRPLARLLHRSLRRAVLRRCLAWMACALMAVVLGNALSQVLGNGRVLRLGVLLTVLSALPAFLFWPLPGRFLLERLRRVDEETVFEAFLEAEPGPVRDILRRLAAERASVLSFLAPEPVWSGLGGLWAAALACLVLVEGGSFLVLGRSMVLEPGPPPLLEGGRRIDEEGFSDFATEDPAARRARRGIVPEGREDRGENPILGNPEGFSGRAAVSDQRPQGGEALSGGQESLGSDAVAKRRQGEREEAQGGAAASFPRTDATGEGHREPGGTAQAGAPPSEGPEPARPGAPPPMPGRTGQGYEHTADTKVPSPLLDYRSRLEARYAERTGQRLAASGRMGFGDLRDFQRRYFESFTLRAEVGAADDPYLAQLKRRWNELKGGLR